MKAVAVLQGQTGTPHAIEAVLKGEDVGGEDVWCTLSGLAERQLLHERKGTAGCEYGMDAIVRRFYYDLLPPAEREKMHGEAGKYYETQEPDVLKAARHFAEAKDRRQAATLVTDALQELINKGQAKPLRRLLDKLVEEEPNREQKAGFYCTRGEFYGLQGERDLARDSYEEALSTLNTLSDSDTVRELKARVRQGLRDLEHHEKDPARPH